jgi:sugar phosphate isomerase/epimerase
MKWVLNTYVTAQTWEVGKIIEVCRATGYDGIEFLMDFKQAHGVEADSSPEHVQGVARQVRDAGLCVASLTSCVTFDSPNPEVLRRSLDQGRRVIDHAARIECDHVRVLGDSLPADEPGRQKMLDQIASALRELGAHAAPHQITVSMEIHGRQFSDPQLSKLVVEKAAQPNVGLVFNSQWRVAAPSGWSLPEGAESIKPLYDLVGEHFTGVHTHRMETLEHLGYYRELFHLLQKDGYQGYVANECAYNGPDPEKVLNMYTALFRALSRY